NKDNKDEGNPLPSDDRVRHIDEQGHGPGHDGYGRHGQHECSDAEPGPTHHCGSGGSGSTGSQVATVVFKGSLFTPGTFNPRTNADFVPVFDRVAQLDERRRPPDPLGLAPSVRYYARLGLRRQLAAEITGRVAPGDSEG